MKDLIEQIYVINLARRPDRKALMMKRLSHHHLLQKTTFIEAIDGKSSPFIDWYLFKVPLRDPLGDNIKQRAEIGCFLSHLKAIRQLVLDGCKRAIIMEDDVMLHNEFLDKYIALVKSIPKNTPLLMLSHYISDLEGVAKYKDHNDVVIPGSCCWGALCYLITNEYAQAVLEAYDRPFGYLKKDPYSLTSEIITTRWRDITKKTALMVKTPLVIEDSKSTDIRPDGELTWHFQYFSQFGIENYNATE